MKTAAATMKGFEVMRMIRRGHCLTSKPHVKDEVRFVNKLLSPGRRCDVIPAIKTAATRLSSTKICRTDQARWFGREALLPCDAFSDAQLTARCSTRHQLTSINEGAHRERSLVWRGKCIQTSRLTRSSSFHLFPIPLIVRIKRRRWAVSTAHFPSGKLFVGVCREAVCRKAMEVRLRSKAAIARRTMAVVIPLLVEKPFSCSQSCH
jgi:hypothetical protein